MSFPGYRSLEYQKPLFDLPLQSMGTARNICGEFIELCTAKLTGAWRLKTDSRSEICPDLHFGGNVWFECKSVGKSNFAIVYQHRYEKEKRYIGSGNQLYYWIWNHNADVLVAKTERELRESIAAKLHSVFVVDVGTVHRLLLGTPLVLNKMYYSNHTAGEFKRSGWKIKTSSILKECSVMAETLPMVVRGVFVKPIPIYVSSMAWQANIVGI